ncbi:hypothetical protein BH09ACT10_BH09ACT10_30890 [soil metagenome]
MTVPTEWSLALPTLDPLRAGMVPVRDAAQAAEDLGYDGLWVGDHLFFRVPILECLTAASYALGATRRIGVGSGVLLPALREPIVLAKQLASIACMADGRFSLGVGVGGEFSDEWDAVGVSLKERGSRTDEFLDLWREWVRGDRIEHEGRHWTFSAPRLSPAPSEHAVPPIWVGGRSGAALARTIRVGGGWLGMLASPDRIHQVAEELARRAEDAATAVPKIGLIIFVRVGEGSDDHREIADYTHANFGSPPEKLQRWTISGSAESVAQQLGRYQAAGVSTFVIHAASRDPIGQFAKIREAVELVATAGTRHA